MPRIIISCPTTGTDVPTGHRTQDFDLSTVIAPRSFRCPACQQIHSWRGDEAWIEGSLTGEPARMAELRS
jgi:hypothetical protein